MHNITKLIWLTIITSTVVACSTQENRGLAPEAQKGRINSPIQQQAAANNSADEYVNRVAKRVIEVSAQPESKYQFRVVESINPGVAYDKESNSILVSSALLNQLNDEAELAAVLSLGVAKYSQTPQSDNITIDYLYRAGYNPKALVDLQEQYLHNVSASNRNYWLSNLSAEPITPSSIHYNKTIIQNMR